MDRQTLWTTCESSIGHEGKGFGVGLYDNSLHDAANLNVILLQDTVWMMESFNW